MSVPARGRGPDDYEAERAYYDLQRAGRSDWPAWADLPPAIRARLASFIRSVESRRLGRGRPTAAQEGRRMVEAG